jgi:hypothetical protein
MHLCSLPTYPALHFPNFYNFYLYNPSSIIYLLSLPLLSLRIIILLSIIPYLLITLSRVCLSTILPSTVLTSHYYPP